ncbi:hypothetical protein [Bacillus sp. EAC]|uniref:hypothetical protein n=1 Tax=Bacillus sp. EAC TaxID=1978338 RepID=UPI000B44D9AB|nr:hypothetical protein [Bacillus sp. EAC]
MVSLGCAFWFLKIIGFFEPVNDIREPISVSNIEWGYLSTEEERMDSITVYSQGHTFGLSSFQTAQFCKLMQENKNNIYKKQNNFSIKVQFRFREVYVINSLYKIDKYNGKESTFYVDKSLIPELKQIYYSNFDDNH